MGNNMKKLILLLALFLCIPVLAYAANTTTINADYPSLKYVTMSFDSTGRQCYRTDYNLYHSAIFKFSGTSISYDYELSQNASPASGESDILQGSMTTSDSVKVTVVAPYICVNVTACTSCSLTVYAYSIPAWRP